MALFRYYVNWLNDMATIIGDIEPVSVFAVSPRTAC